MHRKIAVSFGNKVVPILIQPNETIESVLQRLWANYPGTFSSVNLAEMTLAHTPYTQLVYPTTTPVSDILQWNHLFDFDLIQDPETAKTSAAARSKKDTAALNTIQTKKEAPRAVIPDYDFGDDVSVMSGFSDDDEINYMDFLKCAVDPHDVSILDAAPARLFVIPKRAHNDPAPNYDPNSPHQYAGMCEVKTKGFIQHTYEERIFVVQGYMVFLFKSLQEFQTNPTKPLEKYHIGGLSLYHILQRHVTEEKMRYLLVLKSHDCITAGPTALSIQQALQQSQGPTSPSPAASGPTSPLPTNLLSPKSPSNGSGGFGSGGDVVFLAPVLGGDPDSLICSAFRRDSVQRPPKGFNVITFGSLEVLMDCFEFLRALQYRWLLDISTACATILQRRPGYLTAEGIFRVSGSRDQLNELKTQLYNGVYFDLTTYKDEHIFSNVIKILMRELSDPPMGGQFYQQWLNCYLVFAQQHPQNLQQLTQMMANLGPQDDPWENAQAQELVQPLTEAMCGVLKKLPYYLQNYLSFLFSFVHHVASFREHSKMSYQNLSIVFAPNLLTVPLGQESQSFDNQKKINEMVQRILELCFASFLPVEKDIDGGAMRNVLMYDLDQTKYLSSVYLPLKKKEKKKKKITEAAAKKQPTGPPPPPGTAAALAAAASAALQTPHKSDGAPQAEQDPEMEGVDEDDLLATPTHNNNNPALAQSKLFSPDVLPPMPPAAAFNKQGSRDDTHSRLDTPRITSLISNLDPDGLGFDPAGGFGENADDNSSALDGSIYDGNRTAHFSEFEAADKSGTNINFSAPTLDVSMDDSHLPFQSPTVLQHTSVITPIFEGDDDALHANDKPDLQFKAALQPPPFFVHPTERIIHSADQGPLCTPRNGMQLNLTLSDDDNDDTQTTIPQTMTAPPLNAAAGVGGEDDGSDQDSVAGLDLNLSTLHHNDTMHQSFVVADDELNTSTANISHAVFDLVQQDINNNRQEQNFFEAMHDIESQEEYLRKKEERLKKEEEERKEQEEKQKLQAADQLTQLSATLLSGEMSKEVQEALLKALAQVQAAQNNPPE